MFVFKSWKESITNAELIHQEEEMKLRLTTEQSQTYYMNDTVLQAGTYARIIAFEKKHQLSIDLLKLLNEFHMQFVN